MKEITLGNTKIKIIFPNNTKEENKRRLKNLYDVCNEIFKDNPECFYTHEEVENLKKDASNIFL